MGNPDLDIILDKKLPSLSEVKDRYEIDFKEFALVLFHPVTTENNFQIKVDEFIKGTTLINENLIVIYPNNDTGSEYIINQYEKILRPRNELNYFPQ